MTINIDIITSYTAIAVTAFTVAPYLGGFNRDKFWDEFKKKHTFTTELELLTLILDLARCHWSPKPSNWPGMTITLTSPSGNHTIVLEAGKTKAKDFIRGGKSTYNWSHACLATAGIHHEVFVESAGCDTSTINGNWKGYTQFCSTLDGFTEAHLDAARAAFAAWAASVGLPQQDASIQARQVAAAKQTIANRTKSTSAYGLKNTARYLTGTAVVDADNPTTAVTI